MVWSGEVHPTCALLVLFSHASMLETNTMFGFSRASMLEMNSIFSWLWVLICFEIKIQLPYLIANVTLF
jgi:hypothetical protein